jgi:mono/diheme cytochrome c family protein
MVLGSLALVPFACIARARVMSSPEPAWHLVQDMDNQISFKSQQAGDQFADGRAMRPPVEGTIAFGSVVNNPHFTEGLERGGYTESFPLPVTDSLMARGRQRYEIYCSPCHGLSGYGDGMVARRADSLQQGTWVPPASFHVEPAYSRPVGHLFNTITNGIRNMPAYGSQIAVEDRWAIVAYVRALQRSRHAGIDDVPPDERVALTAEAP